MQNKPNFTFILGTSSDPNSQVSIVLPYSSFDLQASWPIYENATNYFPIRRGNEKQWTLGRAFMQEAYVVADFERQEFHVHQAKFPAPNNRSIKAIHEKDHIQGPGEVISAGTVAAIVFSVIVFVGILISVSCVVSYGKKRNRRTFSEENAVEPSSSDSRLDGMCEKDGDGGKTELLAQTDQELEANSKVELACAAVELPTKSISELESR